MRETQILGGPGPFPTTQWSVIRGARGSDPRAALDVLCRKYWGPVYFHIRRNWCPDVETSKDLAQAFFTALIEKDFLRDVDARKGRFRSFICAALRHFLLNQKRHDAAVKRTPVPPPPGDDFDADWKRAVVEAALERMRAKAAADGKTRLVDLLVRYELDAGDRPTYETLAHEFGLTVFQVTNGLHWARGEFKQACLDEIRDTVTSEEDFRDEAGRLFGR